MENERQKAFLKLKPPCVDLSSTALRFKTQQVSVKDVLRALQAVHQVLVELQDHNQLDSKLAEYAFFPLAQQVFNEARRLSPRCLEVATQCVTVLILHGYRQSLGPELGKQLLILMTMISSGGSQKDSQPTSDELKVATFECIAAIVQMLASSSTSRTAVFEDQSTKNVIDQLTYLLLDSISESPLDNVQLAAAQALHGLTKAINNRVFLASLLPRTVSALTKALRQSTKSKRTQKVLVADLTALTAIILKVLADQVALNPENEAEKEALSQSWLTATAAQMKTALTQVARLRTDHRTEVSSSLRNLCLSVIEECSQSLPDCAAIMVETLVILANGSEGQEAFSALKNLTVSRPEIGDMLRESFFNWCQSLPRHMQGNNDKPKEQAFARLAATLRLLSESTQSVSDLTDPLCNTLVDALSGTLQLSKPSAVEIRSAGDTTFSSLTTLAIRDHVPYEDVLLNHQSQRDSVKSLQQLLESIKNSLSEGPIVEKLVTTVAYASGMERLSSLWLAVQLLRRDTSSSLRVEDIIDVGLTDDVSMSRDSLLDELNATTFPFLGSDHGSESDKSVSDWRLVALSMESLAMNAERYPGDAYRPELINSLYPVLSFLGSANSLLRSHAMTTLDRLARACQYASTADMLIDNSDYLVNSIAWKLNTYNLSTEAPQILQMMVRLCGARLIPYLDDLIQSIFAALDNYHGYPEWVGLLFDTLKAMVDESVKNPQLAITETREAPLHEKQAPHVSNMDDLLNDLRARKKRKLDFDRDASEQPSKTPHRAWTSDLDGPTFPADNKEVEDRFSNAESNLPASTEKEEETKLSKSHQLLLSIANATAPHFASPSPRVRRLLLDLIAGISPLLGRDENSFLPFINSIWPVIVPRLLREHSENEDENEVAYNCCAAADTISALCQTARDFMSSRVEEILPQLIRLFQKMLKNTANIALADDPTSVGAEIKGAVNLQVVKPISESDELVSSAERQQPAVSSTRTSSGQVLNSLIDLLAAILSYVRISLDGCDQIFDLLGPVMNMPGRSAVRTAMETYNADAVWLFEIHSHQLQPPEAPQMRQALQNRGLEFVSVSV